MTQKNETNALAVLPQGIRYDDALWEKIREIWLFLADRNCAKTHRLLLEEFRDVPNFDETKIPTVRQIQNKAKSENWPIWANEVLDKMGPSINRSQIERLFILSEKALTFADRLLDGEFEKANSRVLAIQAAMATELLKFRGLGTASALGGAPTLKIEVTDNTKEDVAHLSITEKSELLRNRVLEKKQMAKLTGHKHN